jgi:UMF1 family MFS transporter
MDREAHVLNRWGAFLRSLALDRPDRRAWALYDWANSAFLTTIVAAVFPIYYNNVAAKGLTPADAASRFAWATTIAMILIAVSAPFLGALADISPWKKRFLAAFMLVGASASAGLTLVNEGEWRLALVLFMLGSIGVWGSLAFYDSLLPHIAGPDELDTLSSSGYALGYLGGGVLLALNLAWILSPATFGFADAGSATRASFVSVAVWWLIFALPLFRRVPEPPVLVSSAAPGHSRLGSAASQLRHTLGELRRFRHAFLMLVAFLVYNDGIGTIIRMASLYGAQLGIAQQHLITALLLVQFVGVPFSFVFGALARRIGAKPAIFLALAVYTVVSVLAYFMTSAREFYVLAVLVGMVQGGSQALSRSLFASMIPTDRTSEFFAFFSVSEKAAGILGPLLFAVAVTMTGSSRAAILSVIAFFVVGGWLLSRVDVAEGRRAASTDEDRLDHPQTDTDGHRFRSPKL